MSQRNHPEEGPIVLAPEGERAQGVWLDVNVCPMPGCPDRSVLVDGFLIEEAGRRAEDPLPEWAFAASVDLDAPGEVQVEACRHPAALRRFLDALDDALRGALRQRFERERARIDRRLPPPRSAGAGSTPAAPPLRGDGWSATPLAPDQVPALLAAFGRGIRARRPGPPPRSARRVGRNDLCPCGSGRKYKRCCLGSA